MSIRLNARHVFTRFALTIVALVVALSFAEMALRLVSKTSDNFWQPDPLLGHVHIPRKSGVWRSPCFHADVKINSWGFRGPEWSREKPPGVVRIAVVGDSLIEGFQVPFDDVLTTVLERKLNEAAGGRRFEVLNLGVGSYGAGQSYLNLVHRGFAFDPDVVLFGFSIKTSLRADSRALEGRKDKPYFRLGATGLVLQPFQYPPAYYGFKSAVRSLRLYETFGIRLSTSPWTREIMLRLGLAEPLSRELEAELRHTSVSKIPWDLTVYAKDYPPAWAEAWDIVGAVLVRMNADVRRRGGNFRLFAVGDIVGVTAPAAIDARYPGFRENYDVEKPDRVLAGFAKRHDIEMVSLPPVFRSAVASGTRPEEIYLPCDAHMTALGHRLVADTLFKSVTKSFSVALDRQR